MKRLQALLLTLAMAAGVTLFMAPAPALVPTAGVPASAAGAEGLFEVPQAAARISAAFPAIDSPTASGMYGEPRATHDSDVLVQLRREQGVDHLQPLVQRRHR